MCGNDVLFFLRKGYVQHSCRDGNEYKRGGRRHGERRWTLGRQEVPGKGSGGEGVSE